MNSAKRWAWKSVCAAVTLLSIAYVVSQIAWHDRYVSGGEEHVGFEARDEADQRWLVQSDGTRIVLAGEGASDGVFLPGFRTLLQHIDWRLFLLGLAGSAVPIGMMAYRWQLFLKTEQLDPGLAEVTRLTWLGTFAANFLPGSTGTDIAKILCMCRRQPGHKLAIATTVILNRLMGLISLLLIGAAALLLQRAHPSLWRASGFVYWTLLGCFFGCVLLFSRRLQKWARLDAWVPKLPLGSQVLSMRDCFLRYRGRPMVLVHSFGLSVLLQATTIVSIYCFGLSLGLAVPMSDYFLLIPVIFVAAAATPAINGLGVREGAFQLLFSAVGASTSEGLALCLLNRIAGMLVSLPGALFFWQETRHAERTTVPSSALEEPLRHAA